MQSMDVTLSSSISELVELNTLTLYYPIFESTGEEGIFMLGNLYSGTSRLHDTPASCQFTRSNKDFFTVSGKMLFPLFICDCPRDTSIVLTLLDKNMKPFAFTSIALFSDEGKLRQGYQKVEFFAYTKDGESYLPRDCGYRDTYDYLKWEDMNDTAETSQCEWLEQITKDRCNEVTSSSIQRKQKYLEALGRKLYNRKFSLPPVSRSGSVEHADIGTNEICLEMVFRLPHYGDVSFSHLEYNIIHPRQDRLALVNACMLDSSKLKVISNPSANLWEDPSPIYYDAEIGRINPVDQKVMKLKRSVGRRFYSPDDKPTNEEKTQLMQLINTPLLPAELTDEEKTLLWTFRHVLYGMRHALPKILYAMDLNDPHEKQNAIKMLNQWPNLCLEDALQLLSRTIQVKEIRDHAVTQLNTLLNDDDLELYLLQLVQALRYEDDLYAIEDKEIIEKHLIRMVRQEATLSSPENDEDVIPEVEEKTEVAEEKAEVGTEEKTEEVTEEKTEVGTEEKTEVAEEKTETTEEIAINVPDDSNDVIEEEVEEKKIVRVIVPHSRLLIFLFERCSTKRTLASLLLHYLRVEGNINAKNESDRNQDFINMEQAFCDYMKNHEDCSYVYEELVKEEAVVDIIFKLSTRISELGGRAQKKQENLRYLLTSDANKVLYDYPLLPIRPDLCLSHVLASTAKVFQSAMTPFSLEFVIEGSERGALPVKSLRRDSVSTISEADSTNEICKGCGNTFAKCTCLTCIECKSVLAVNKHHCRDCRYAICSKCSEMKNNIRVCCNHDACDKRSHLVLKVMFKNGDDVRQDQMVIQMIRLMDKLMKDMNLDLCLSPYSVLAISSSQGMLEMIQNSTALSGVKSIRQFLRERHPDNSNDLGIKPDIMNIYVRSCAGYAVITYLLGIGDRHLDNIMIDDMGHLFHIDFGYIFGQDPKVKEAKIRITNDMLDGMGGQTHKNYQLFLGYIFQAYHILRQNAILLITLLRLMLDANIKDCKPEYLNKMIERFNLSMTDEEAENEFQKVLKECIGAFLDGVLELAHNVATVMR